MRRRHFYTSGWSVYRKSFVLVLCIQSTAIGSCSTVRTRPILMTKFVVTASFAESSKQRC